MLTVLFMQLNINNDIDIHTDKLYGEGIDNLNPYLPKKYI